MRNAIVKAAIITSALLFSANAEWTFKPAISMKESYDDNVYLQDRGALANHSSMVTSIVPSIAFDLRREKEATPLLSLGYAPELAFYHSEHGEDYVNHSLFANVKTSSGPWSLDMTNTINIIDGSDEGLTFTAPGAIPAMGGIPIRDRRDAAIYRTNYRVRYDSGNFMLRPVVTTYVHDFQTKHSAAAGYENYVDRSEFAGGIDAGYKLLPNTYAILGYRFGYQHQAELLDNPLDYSNYYNRVLVGIEGKPQPWLKLCASIGPDFRSYTGDTVADFDHHQTEIFVDGLAVVTFSKDDELSFIIKQFMQPSYCGRAIYEDLTYQLTYKHQFSPKLSASALFKIYGGEWEKPSTRNDRIYTAGLGLCYKWNAHLSAEAGYSFDSAESNVPDTEGREYHRSVVFVGLKYEF